jgi:hypothetical protein
MAELYALLKQGRFAEAASQAENSLRAAKARGSEPFLETAREVVAWKGFFPNRTEEQASVPYFRAVLRVMEELAGPDSGAALAAADNLAGILGGVDQLAEAIALKERVYARVAELYPSDDPRVLSIRDGLAFLSRRAGDTARADELYLHTGICKHLLPVEEFLRGRGEKPVSCGRPWSENCHLWVGFDLVLDCEALLSSLSLDSCVRIHDHRGTVEGSERGLVCLTHHDAIIGRRPAD